MPKPRAEFCDQSVVARLIQEVKIRPCLWNPTDKDYKYKQHMAATWEEISSILNIREDLLRMKWKNLRDFFKKIIRQWAIRDVNDYTGGWCHFRSLWFINQTDLLQNDGDSSDEATNTNNDEATNTSNDEATSTSNELVKCEPVEFSETEVFTEEPVPIPEEKLATNSDDDHDQMILKKRARNSDDDDHDQMFLKKRATNTSNELVKCEAVEFSETEVFTEEPVPFPEEKLATNSDDDHDQMIFKKRATNSDDDDHDQMFLKKRATSTSNELVKCEAVEFSETEVFTEEPVPIPEEKLATNSDDDHDQMIFKKRATNSVDDDYNQMFLKKRARNSNDDDHDQMFLKKRATNSVDDDYNQMFLKKRARNSNDDDHDQMMLKKRATNSDDNDYDQMFLKKRARNSNDDDHDQMMLKKRATNSDDNDYDQMFLRSLTPYFKQLEPIRKLVIRNKIQEILLKELATQKNSSNHFC